MTLHSITRPALIISNLQALRPEAALADLVRSLESEGLVTPAVPFLDLAIARERSFGAVYAPGMAIPHVRSPLLPQLALAVGRAARGLGWFGSSPVLVRGIFLFSIPESQSGDYLGAVAAIARMTQIPSFWEKFLTAPDEAAILDLLADTDGQSARGSGNQPLTGHS